MKSVVVIIAAVATYFNLQVVEGGPYTISDERVRSLDITPVLGRGYSIGTNSFQSTCLMVDEVTSPSYNYDYNFKDYSKNSESEIGAAATAEASFSAHIISGEASSRASVDTKSTSQMRMITASMKIQRYYSSVREELSPLSEDALTLLDSQDYIGFFKSCGPNYVRSIRRAQELTAIFKFSASSTSVATEFAASIKGEGAGRSISASVSGNSKFSSAKSSLKIIILGFGLGLNNEGSSTLVSTTLEEYNEVMKFGFISFTQSEDSHNIGMVYGMEIVPWVDNTAFQVASKLLDEEVEIALPRSLIPKALMRASGEESTGFTNNADSRGAHRCKEGIHHIDKYGYCCEVSSLFNTATQEYTQEEQDIEVSLNVCMPVRKLDKSVVKNNMSNNGEFVAHLDSIVRYRLNQIFTLEKCLTSVNSYDSTYDMYILKAQDSVKYDATIEAKYTVLDLKMALDPAKDYGLLQSLGNELDEFVEMYYSPCIAALFGTNIGSNPDVEPQYFLAYGWLTHDACAHLSCLADNMRWDRRRGGCTAGTITGSAIEFGDNDSEVIEHCAKDDNPLFSGEEKCKHPEATLKEFQDKANDCWTGVVPYYIMNHFCMPQLTGNVADPLLYDEVIARRGLCTAHADAAPATPNLRERRLFLN